MKLTAGLFTNRRNVFKNHSLEETSCFIDDIKVPIRECSGLLEREAYVEASILDFWKTECEGHPTNSHCKVYEN